MRLVRKDATRTANADASRPPPLRSKNVVSGPSCSYESASSTIVVVSSSNVTTKLMCEVYDDEVVDRKRNNLWMMRARAPEHRSATHRLSDALNQRPDGSVSPKSPRPQGRRVETMSRLGYGL